MGSCSSFAANYGEKNGGNATCDVLAPITNENIRLVSKYFEMKDPKHDHIGLVEHYMPPEFPLIDRLNNNDITRCRMSYVLIKGKRWSRELTELMHSKLVNRYEKFLDFFNDPFQLSKSLDMALSFILNINQMKTEERNEGYAFFVQTHSKERNISLYMYALFMSCLVESLAIVLEKYASPEVMESWTRLCSFTLRQILTRAVQVTKIKKLSFVASVNPDLSDSKVKSVSIQDFQDHLNGTDSMVSDLECSLNNFYLDDEKGKPDDEKLVNEN